jgi:drug/metabolite transporter (DMT)-like permease
MLVPLSLCVAFLWGLSPILHKYVLTRGLSPETLLSAAGLVTALCIAAYAAFNAGAIGRDLPTLGRPDVLAAVVLAAVATTFFAAILYYYLVKHNACYVVTALTNTAPAFTLVMAVAFLGEEVTAVKALGVLAIIVGAVLVAL